MFLVRIRSHSITPNKIGLASRLDLPEDAVFWVAALAATCSILAGASLAPGLVGIAEALGPEREILSRLVITMPALGVPIGALLLGRMARLDQHRTSLLVAIYLFAFSGLAAGMMRDYTAILALRFVQGLSVGAIMVVAMGMLARGANSRARMGLQSTVMTVSTVAILLVGGFAAAMVWWLPFAMSLLPLFLVRPIHALPESAFEAPKVSAANSGQSLPLAKPGALISALIFAFLAMVAFYAIPTQMPARLAANGVDAPIAAAAMIIVSVIAAAAGGIVFRKTAGHISITGILTCAFFLKFLGFTYLAYSVNWPPMVLGTAMIGLGFGMVFPALNHWASTVNHSIATPAAIAAMTAAFQLGQFFSPVAGSPALSSSDVGFVYLPYAVLGAAALVLLYTNRRAFEVSESTEADTILEDHIPAKVA